MSKAKYFSTLDTSEKAIEFCNYLIETYGEVKFVKSGFKRDDEYLLNVYHDFIYYCFTKSTKSLFASVELSKKLYREDSLIILRTVYENYLHISHTLSCPPKIQEYVFQSIGISTGTYSYKKRSNNSTDFKVVVDNRTLEQFQHGTSRLFMAKNSIRKIDLEIHKSFYRYLSEYTHPNMMGSGDYRNAEEIHYTVNSKYMYLEVAFVILYLCFILQDAIFLYHTTINDWNLVPITQSDLLLFNSYQESVKKDLMELIQSIDFDAVDINLKRDLIKRISIS